MDHKKKIKTNILRMLETRGYDIANIDENIINGNDEMFLLNKKNDKDSKIYVFLPELNTKIGVYIIKQYIKEMHDTKVRRSIVVVKDAVTAFAKQVFKDAARDTVFPVVIECFKENELLIDKLNHVLVPRHELISDEEKKEILKIYRAKETQLPKILSSDPIVRYFGASKGQVFKITRFSESSGEYIYYRIVI
jgi:DNA-directed RNA polymerase I, II, and III subunit RPABC1